MSDKPFYITTPIYYANGEPHLGHAYTTILADVLARFARLQGRTTFFLTGVDEHGQKVAQAAAKQGITPQEQTDRMAATFRQAWDKLNIAYDDFIRTTETRHKRVVTAVLQKLWEQGDIYLDQYEGWYCVPDERFWTEKDLVDGRCPDCLRPVEQITEANYFFRMSRYQDWLIEYIQTHPQFIRPESRRNEVLGFLRQPLGDLCISRPVKRLSWGIPLPFDPDYVTYVWFDALLNYVTAVNYLQSDYAPQTAKNANNENNQASKSASPASISVQFQTYWPQVLHLIGKDILTTHAVYWPTMLRAAGLSQPRMILAHGWWVVDGAKMSKSIGNVQRPLDLADVYGVDALRYFLMRNMTLGRDADFNIEVFQQRYQADLANNLGNLQHRVTSMIGRFCNGRIPQSTNPTAADRALQQKCKALIPQTLELVENLAVNAALNAVFDVITAINRYLEQSAPWTLAKKGETERVDTVLYHAAEALRLTAVLLQPVMPEKTAELWRRLGWQPPRPLRDGLEWGLLVGRTAVTSGPPLFPRDV